MTETVNKVKGSLKSGPANHPFKVKASIFGMLLGLVGCGTVPIGATLRLVCGTATGVMDIVDKVNQSRNMDAGVSPDASDSVTTAIANLRDN